MERGFKVSHRAGLLGYPHGLVLTPYIPQQVQHRVESTVSFAHDYVKKLQDEQTERYKENIRKKPKEFRSSCEMQVEGMLAVKSEYSCSKRLRGELDRFTRDLKLHCGSSFSSKQDTCKPTTMEKLQKLVSLVASFNDPPPSSHKKRLDSHVITLQRLITQTMISWGNKEIHDLKLIEEIFSLLYRQFNEVGEVAQALKKTYVLEVTCDPVTGKHNFDIPAFTNALGSLRLLLKVGMSRKEENLLKTSLK